MAGSARIATAAWASDLADVRMLLREYQASLDVDLCFQGFDAELHGLPGDYAAPRGLYVRPQARAAGIGRALASHVVAAAALIGYDDIVLDVLPSFTAALGVYRRLGFVPTAPYCDNPVPGTQWLQRDLRRAD